MNLPELLEEMSDLPEFLACGPEAHPNGIGVNSVGGFGNRPLHIAATRGDVEAIKLLLEGGAEIDAQGEEGFTALHDATLGGRLDAARYLFASGASPDIRNDDGRDARYIATLHGYDLFDAGELGSGDVNADDQ